MAHWCVWLVGWGSWGLWGSGCFGVLPLPFRPCYAAESPGSSQDREGSGDLLRLRDGAAERMQVRGTDVGSSQNEAIQETLALESIVFLASTRLKNRTTTTTTTTTTTLVSTAPENTAPRRIQTGEAHHSPHQLPASCLANLRGLPISET